MTIKSPLPGSTHPSDPWGFPTSAGGEAAAAALGRFLTLRQEALELWTQTIAIEQHEHEPKLNETDRAGGNG